MKKLNLKNLLKFAALITLVAFIGTSCKKEKNDTPATLIEDGVYVYGPGTALSGLALNGMFKATKNEATQQLHTGLVELYIAVKGNASTDAFNIYIVEGGVSKTYGPGTDFAEVPDNDKITDEPRGWFSRGSLIETNETFKVPEDGLYHVVYDKTTKIVVVARVEWGIIGGATELGWSSSVPLPLTGGFNLEKMTFKGEGMALTLGEFKFRYSNGWKIEIDVANPGTVLVNTNYGGAVNALEPGGDNIDNTETGIYTITVDWNLNGGITAKLEITGDYEPPTYPDMYIVGEATAYGWDAPGNVENAIMHRCAGGAPSEGIFWKICHLEGEKGFKLSAANWTNPNIGYAEVSEYDNDGITISDDSGNMKIDESGMYMVVLNLRDNAIKVSIKPAAVYGIGDTFGGYNVGVEENKFTVNNDEKSIVSPALPASGNIRMYASHTWIADWWHAEFRVADGKIDYRNDGGDQDAVAGTAGQVITLFFDSNEGGIAK